MLYGLRYRSRLGARELPSLAAEDLITLF